jgi:hypothetical protein
LIGGKNQAGSAAGAKTKDSQVRFDRPFVDHHKLIGLVDGDDGVRGGAGQVNRNRGETVPGQTPAEIFVVRCQPRFRKD